MASIMCRKGETFPNSHRHDSVAAVRACQGASGTWAAQDKPFSDRDGNWTPASQRDPKNEYLNPKGINAQLAAFDGSRLGVTGAEAMAGAERMTRELGIFGGKVNQGPGTKSGPLRVDPELEARVPDGRYALERDGEVKFYRVRKVTTGRWAGRTFVDRQAGDETHPVRYANDRAKILREIAADVKAAAIRYGRELGQCSQCGRTLTNPESIALGIGPICLNKVS